MISREKKNDALTSLDWGVLVAIVVIYGVLSFINLGRLSNPQTFWSVEEGNRQVIMRLDAKTHITKMRYFSGARFGDYKLSVSQDNIYYEELMTLEEGRVFAWFDVPIDASFQYLAIDAIGEEGTIGEIGLYDDTGHLVPLSAETPNGSVLVDEQTTIPEEISYQNSTYFDEVYHARTAYEYLNGLEIYEWTHPPLGKLIMSIPVHFMGMSPFYYRLAGNVAGILMLIAIYIFAKRLLGETKYAFLATFLLVVDGMHFVQTRIATVDSYLVLFILLAYLFMYEYIRCSNKSALSIKFTYLFFSGVFLGAAIATKWNGAYTALGLAIIFFIDFFSRTSEGYHNYTWREQAPKIIGGCFIFFLIIPIGIYLLSYLPFFLNGEGNTLQSFFDLQLRMYHYHADLEASHPFASPWYLWPLDMKPMWYYKGDVPEGFIASIVAHGNPFIWWAGIVGMLYTFKEAIVERDKKDIFISIAILAAYLPYLFIGRIMFIYHYFPVVPFMILALVGAIRIFDKHFEKIATVKIVSIVALLGFVFFYPIYAGVTIPRWYGMIMQWLPGWQFF